MWIHIAVVLLGVAVAPSLAQIDCSNLEDGSYGHGCVSYTRCEGGRGTIVNCQAGQAFDWRSGVCEPWSIVPPPCGEVDNDCTGREDGKYAIMPTCMYFYTCYLGVFAGTNPCNNPPDQGELRFDETLQTCNYHFAFEPPCGTAEPTTASDRRGRILAKKQKMVPT